MLNKTELAQLRGTKSDLKQTSRVIELPLTTKMLSPVKHKIIATYVPNYLRSLRKCLSITSLAANMILQLLVS